jgi:hypothetical protein
MIIILMALMERMDTMQTHVGDYSQNMKITRQKQMGMLEMQNIVTRWGTH